MAGTRITVKRDGKPVVVEVSDDLTRATIGARTYEVRLVADNGTKVELEIGKEQVAVGGWPAACATPPGLVDVNGEAWKVEVELEASRTGSSVRRIAPASNRSSAVPAAAVEGPTAAGSVPIVPPMPGRIIEVKVKEGETVAKGAVLLVLEAMKMRNEVASPIAGVVRQLQVKEGANVRARETMMLVVPP